MAITGADIERLRELSTKFSVDWAGQLEQLISQIDGQVQASVDIWTGDDANQFRGQVWPEHKSRMNNARDVLVQAGEMAKRNVEAQVSTSSTLA